MGDVRMIGPMPQFGYGTWNRKGEEAYRGVRDALDLGYRHIDTAEGYGNEEHVGRAIADSGIARADIFLTTKVAPESFAPGQIMGHVERSLQKLRTDAVDLLLLHYPSINDEYDIVDYVGQFAEVYDRGLTRHIGVSNFTKRYLDRAIELLGRRKLLTNQVECHVFMQNRSIVDYTQKKGIVVTAYSPLARGGVAGNAVIAEIAESHGATPAQVALAFLAAQDFVVIPSSGKRERIAENLAAKDVSLSDDEMARLRRLEAGRRLVDGPWCPVWDS